MSTALSLTYVRGRDALIIAFAALNVLLYVLAAGGFGFPLDDSWIHQTYGRNLAITGLWAFVPGIPSGGSTSPLYTILLAAGYRLGVPYTLWTHTLGVFALALGGLAAARMARHLFPQAKGVGLWAGLAVVFSWHLVWAASSGMETMLFVGLCLLQMNIVLVWLNATPPNALHNGLLYGLCGGLLMACRLEGVALVCLGAAVLILAWFGQKRRAVIVWGITTTLSFAMAFALYAVINSRLAETATIFPNTLYAKQADAAPLLARGPFINFLEMARPLTPGGQAWLIFGAVYALVVQWKTRDRLIFLRLLPLAWTGGLLLIYALRLPTPFQHGRYVMGSLAAYIVLGVGGTLLLVQSPWLRRARWGRVARMVLSSTAVVLFSLFYLMGIGIYARDVSFINSDMVTAARWVQNNIQQTDLLAVHDIGAVGYFSMEPDRPRQILDTAGLISPEMIPALRNPDLMWELLQKANARYLMVLPDQWEDMWGGQPQRWAPFFCLRFDAKGGMGGMRIYAVNPVGFADCPAIP
jgi:hypothetical protein